MITKICPQCNKSFTTEFKTQRFCSRPCVALSMSRKVELTCPVCSRIVYVYKGTKFCSKACADSARRGIKISPVVMKTCPVCNKSFESKAKVQRFCSRECGNKGRAHNTYILTEEQREARVAGLKRQWRDEKFRQIVVNRMKTNNPVYRPGVVEKANNTRAKNGKMHNNFKYGNGKVGPYEQLVKDKVESLGFIYNYAIKTKIARDADPGAHYAKKL